jgi:hypothetical protein
MKCYSTYDIPGYSLHAWCWQSKGRHSHGLSEGHGWGEDFITYIAGSDTPYTWQCRSKSLTLIFSTAWKVSYIILGKRSRVWCGGPRYHLRFMVVQNDQTQGTGSFHRIVRFLLHHIQINISEGVHHVRECFIPSAFGEIWSSSWMDDRLFGSLDKPLPDSPTVWVRWDAEIFSSRTDHPTGRLKLLEGNYRFSFPWCMFYPSLSSTGGSRNVMIHMTDDIAFLSFILDNWLASLGWFTDYHYRKSSASNNRQQRLKLVREGEFM